jgi:hypothetical protein
MSQLLQSACDLIGRLVSGRSPAERDTRALEIMPLHGARVFRADATSPTLMPDVTWVIGEVGEPDAGAGIVLDGFVPLGGRWSWFPRPWRYLPPRGSMAHVHWAE